MRRPTARKAAAMATNDPRHEPVAPIDVTTTSGPRAAPMAHDAWSQPMNRTPRFREVWALAAASMRPEPPPSSRVTTGTIHHAVARPSPSKPAAASPQPLASKTAVPRRVLSAPLPALATKYAAVNAASKRPSPASGAPSEARMGGQATPMAPAGKPRATKRKRGVPVRIQVGAPAPSADLGSITRRMGERDRADVGSHGGRDRRRQRRVHRVRRGLFR